MSQISIIEISANLLVAFSASCLTYYFGIRHFKKSDEHDKIKELNNIISNLLLVWHHLSRIEIVIEMLSQNKYKVIVPKRNLPYILIKQGLFNEDSFNELDISINAMKKYDPILFYDNEGLGRRISKLNKSYIQPYLKSQIIEKPYQIKETGFDVLISSILDEIETAIEDISIRIGNKKLRKRTNEIINEYFDKSTTDLIDEVNYNIYDFFLEVAPNQFYKMTFEDFIKHASHNDFQKSFSIQLDALMNDRVELFLKIVTENPKITLDELKEKLNE